MRTITAAAITDTVARLCIQANTHLPEDIVAALDRRRKEEPWPLAKETLGLLWDNMELAEQKDLPICQDTGMACVFVELGTDVHIDGHFEEAIHEGVRRGYTDGYLRKSIVADPLRRGNTGDFAYAFLHHQIHWLRYPFQSVQALGGTQAVQNKGIARTLWTGVQYYP